MLGALRRIVQEVNREPVLEQALARLTQSVKREMATDCCSIYLAEHDTGQFVLRATDGLSQDAVGLVSIGFSEGLIGLVGQREEPLNISNCQSHQRFKLFPDVKEEAYNAFLGSPIIHRRKVLGVLCVQQLEARQYDENEEAFLVTLAAQLASSIAHADARGGLAGDSEQNLSRSFYGVAASSGVGLGTAYVYQAKADLKAVNLQKVYRSDAEVARFHRAVAATRKELRHMAGQMDAEVSEQAKEIIEIYRHLLDANSLGHMVESQIRSGWCAVSALSLAVDNVVAQFEQMQDPYLRERAADVKDLGNQVLEKLIAKKADKPVFPDACVIVAEEITASMLASVPVAQLKAVVARKGSTNSHAAILARAMGVPAVLGASDIPLGQLHTRTLVVDGYSGELVVSPSASLQREYQRLVEEESELQQKVLQEVDAEAKTKDGQSIALLLNSGLGIENESQYADGVGLYRTEVPFMTREQFPSEQEQYLLYQGVLERHSEQSVTMRTLDIGGDKALPYFPIQEENPFLGWRGIRLTLDHPDIFLIQIRAMLRANIARNNLKIMLPMIASIEEVFEARRLIRQALFELQEELGCTISMPELGVMVEVPALIYQIERLSEVVDFVSVGSNDLTQYLLAVDRNNPRVADLYQPLHPSVLAALNDIAIRARKAGLNLSICGEMASDAAGAYLLLGMGYRQLSMSAQHIPKVKWLLRKIEILEAEKTFAYCLTLPTPEKIQDYLNHHLETLGLGGFVRAGK